MLVCQDLPQQVFPSIALSPNLCSPLRPLVVATFVQYPFSFKGMNHTHWTHLFAQKINDSYLEPHWGKIHSISAFTFAQ